MNVLTKFAATLLILAPLSLCAQSAEPTQPVAPAAPQSADPPAPIQPKQDRSEIRTVGGGVTEPKLLKHPDPEYTDEARRIKLNGVCTLWLIVDAQGNPRNIKVIHSISEGVPGWQRSAALSLDANAVKALKKYRFKPAIYQGQPIPVTIQIEISFKIY